MVDRLARCAELSGDSATAVTSLRELAARLNGRSRSADVHRRLAVQYELLGHWPAALAAREAAAEAFAARDVPARPRSSGSRSRPTCGRRRASGPRWTYSTAPRPTRRRRRAPTWPAESPACAATCCRGWAAPTRACRPSGTLSTALCGGAPGAGGRNIPAARPTRWSTPATTGRRVMRTRTRTSSARRTTWPPPGSCAGPAPPW